LTQRPLWQKPIAAAIIGAMLAACSGPAGTGQTIVPAPSRSGAAPAVTAKTLKTLTYPEQPAGIIPGGSTASQNLGVANWGVYATTDNKVISVAALSRSGGILWSVDVSAVSNGPSYMLTSLGTSVYESVPNGPVYVAKGPLLDAKYADAFKADAAIFYGAGGTRPPGGPQPALQYKAAVDQPCCNTLPISILGFAFAVSATADAIIVGGLIAVGPIGWAGLALATIALGADLYNEHREYNAHPPETPPGVGDPGGPTLGGPPSGGGGGGDGSGVTRVCVGDESGNVTCWLTFYY